MREREYNMDYLRIFACFMVIFLHVAAQNWSSVEVTGKQWHVFNLGCGKRIPDAAVS